jgi:diguanylate cyclase (GGDEF)-like protein
MGRRLELFLLLAALPAAAGAYLHWKGGSPLPVALAAWAVLVAAVASFGFRTNAAYRALARAAADRERDLAARREELQLRVDFLSAQREISLVLNEDVDFRAVLDRVLAIACDLLGGDAELWMRAEDKLVLRAARRRGKTDFEFAEPADAAVLQCIADGRVVTVSDGWKLHALAPLQSDREIVGAVRVSSLLEENPVAREKRAALLASRLPEFSKFLALALKTPDLYTRAVQDGLTGLWTKRHFLTQAKDLLAAARRYGEPLAIIMVDVDHFKKVNDQHGHQAGDEVLKGVAAILRKKVRGGMAFRYGGEEMSVLLPKAGAAGAAEVAERLRQAIDAHRIAGIKVTASFGVAEFDAAAMSGWEDLVERADEALYKAKEGGRNRVVTASVHGPPSKVQSHAPPVLAPPRGAPSTPLGTRAGGI